MKAIAKRLQTRQVQRTLIIASYFQLCWLLIALIVAAAGQYVNGWWLLVIVPGFWAPIALELLTKVTVPAVLQVHYYLFLSASAVLGDIFGFYSMIWRWDTISQFRLGHITCMAWAIHDPSR